MYIPLINRVRGPQVMDRVFPRLIAQARSALAIKRGEKQGSITYSTDQTNEVNKMFIIWGYKGPKGLVGNICGP